jgi:hypothetical protein
MSLILFPYFLRFYSCFPISLHSSICLQTFPRSLHLPSLLFRSLFLSISPFHPAHFPSRVMTRTTVRSGPRFPESSLHSKGIRRTIYTTSLLLTVCVRNTTAGPRSSNSCVTIRGKHGKLLHGTMAPAHVNSTPAEHMLLAIY